MSTNPVAPQASGVTSNVAGAICYLTIIPAVVFLVLEPYRRDGFIRFHAWQSIVFWVFSAIVDILLRIIPFPIIGWAVWDVVTLILFLVWLVVILKAFQNQRWKIPLLGDIAARQSGAL